MRQRHISEKNVIFESEVIRKLGEKEGDDAMTMTMNGDDVQPSHEKKQEATTVDDRTSRTLCPSPAVWSPWRFFATRKNKSVDSTRKGTHRDRSSRKDTDSVVDLV